MQLEHAKATLAAVWVLAVCAVAESVNVSVSNWTVLGCLAVFPPLAMMRYWNHPDQTLSHSIQKVIR